MDISIDRAVVGERINQEGTLKGSIIIEINGQIFREAYSATSMEMSDNNRLNMARMGTALQHIATNVIRQAKYGRPTEEMMNGIPYKFF